MSEPPGRPAQRRAPLTAAALAVVFASALGACDGPSVEEIVLPAGEPTPFDVAETNVRESLLPAGEDLVVRFSRPVDTSAFGPRSVTVRMPRRRRVSGTIPRTAADEVRIPAEALRTLAPDEIAELRIEGGASPCAVRAADGEALAERVRIAFRVANPRRVDLVGPSLAAARPADGASDVAPSALLELRFSETLAERSAADAVTVREDGVAVPAKVRLGADRRRIFVRPARALRAGAHVEVDVHGSVADAAGNLLDRGSSTRVAFDVRRSPTLEMSEDFASDEFLDRTATDCAWGEAEEPGLLAPRRGATPLPCLAAEPTTDLGDRDEIRFQLLVRGDETVGGLGSLLRLRLTRIAGAGVRAAHVEGGALPAPVLDPWFLGNRERANLELLAEDAGPFLQESDEAGGGWVEVPFTRPLTLERGVPLLLDVTLTMEPGTRLAASADVTERALLRGAPGERLLPSVELLVSGADPTARSLWYDAGAGAVRWRGAAVELDPAAGQAGILTEFQSAPADAHGQPDLAQVSEWVADPAIARTGRFVRFRMRFGGVAPDARLPRVDRVVMFYERP